MMMLTPNIQILISTKFQTPLRKLMDRQAVRNHILNSNTHVSLKVIRKNKKSRHIIKIGTVNLIIVGAHPIPAVILGKMHVKLLLLKDSKI